MKQFLGQVAASQLISLRFPESGRLAWIKCGPGNLVKKGAALAGLDPKPVQTQLDIELADYRRIRAEFDKLSREIPEPKNDDEKTTKEVAQSKLEVSVKAVEKYKLKLDQMTLYAPVNAVVLSTMGLVPGVNLTPSAFPIEIAQTDNVMFEIQVSEKEVYDLAPNQKAKIEFKNGQKFESEIIYISPQAVKEKFAVRFSLPGMDLSNFRLGTTGKVAV